MAKRSEPQIMEPLTDDEFGELDDLLLSDDLSEPASCINHLVSSVFAA